jgi:hypothetical protein
MSTVQPKQVVSAQELSKQRKPRSTAARIRHAVQTLGPTRTANILQMNREVVLAIAAGAKVRERSRALADLRVEALSASGAGAG